MAENSTEIAHDTIFRGEIVFEDRLEISGLVEGVVKGPGILTIHQGGNFKGDLQVKQVTINGKLQGNVAAASFVQIGSQGQLHGDIECNELQIERGGKHSGTTVMT